MRRREFIKGGMMAAGVPLIFSGCRTFCGNSKINVAIIGCGRISTEFEVPGVLARKDIARIVAVCDLDMKRAKLTAARVEREYADGTKVRIYKDYKEVCAPRGTPLPRLLPIPHFAAVLEHCHADLLLEQA